MTHEEYRETLALHALGSVETAERLALESHLVVCPSCSTELAELRETATHLALLATPIPPSPASLQRLLAATEAPPDRPPVRERRRWRRLVLAGRVGVAAVIVVLSVSQLRLLERLDDAYTEIDRMQAIGRFVTSANVSVVPLWGPEAAGDAHAKLAYDRTTGRFVLISARLPSPPEGTGYQLWVISERFRPVAAFSPESPDGVLRAPPRRDEPFLFAVSVEPVAEVDEPTGRMVLMSGLLRNPP